MAKWASALLLVATAAVAAPVGEYGRALRRLDRRERAYFDEFRRSFLAAIQVRQSILIEYHHLRSNEIDSVNDSIRALWERLEAIERERGEAARVLGRSGDAGAPARLLADLFAAVEQADALDRAILVEKSRSWHYFNRQAPAFRRAQLARRVRDLGAALRPSQPLLAGDGWKQATARDRKRSVARRVALLELLDDGPLLRAQLAAREYPLRIVAAERLVASGPTGLAVLLADENPLVRRALIQEVRRRAAGDARWIAPLLGHYPSAAGGEREEALRTLQALTGKAIRDDPAAWKRWYELHRFEIDAGRFRRAPRGDEVVTEAAPATPTFCGIALRPRDGLVFLCDWGDTIMSPCDNAFQRTRMFVDWFGMDMSAFPEWEKKHPSLRRVFMKQFRGVVSALPDRSRVGLVLLEDGSKNDYAKFQARANLPPRPLARKQRRALDRALESVVPGWSRWQAPYSGILIAMRLSGLDPAAIREPVEIGADTFVLFGNGLIRGSRFALPEHTVEDFVRRNRFRRIRVHTVHVGTEGRESSRLLEGLAHSSDGTYVRLTKAP